MQLQLAANTYVSRALTQSGQRLVNGYAMQAQGKWPIPVYRTPGIKAFATLEGVIRGGEAFKGVAYVVAGTTLYAVDRRGDATAIGAIPGSGGVDMAAGLNSLVIVAEGTGYRYDGTLTTITDPDFRYAYSVDWVDGFFVFRGPGQTWFASELNDSTDYDVLSYDQALGSPDDLVQVMVSQREVVLFGAKSLEFWYNAGTTPFPFRRRPDGYAELGCKAPNSPAIGDNTFFWLASDGSARMFRDGVPQRISTDGIEYLLEQGDRESAFGMYIAHGGRYSYVLSLDTGTYEYEIQTGLWNERESYGVDNWQVQGLLTAYDKTLVWSGAKLGHLDTATYTEWGDPLVWRAVSEPVTEGPGWLFHGALEVDADMGQGSLTVDPQLMLRYSDDSGRHWSAEAWRTLGREGEYGRRARWHRLGRSRNRVYELSFSEDAPFTFMGAHVEMM